MFYLNDATHVYMYLMETGQHFCVAIYVHCLTTGNYYEALLSVIQKQSKMLNHVKSLLAPTKPNLHVRLHVILGKGAYFPYGQSLGTQL